MKNDNVLKDLSALGKKKWTGSISVLDRSTGESASVYLYCGGVYAVDIHGFQRSLINRLMSAGVLNVERRGLFEGSMAAPEDESALGRFAIDQQWITVEKLGQFHGEYLLAGLGAVVMAPHLSVTVQREEVTGKYCALPTPIEDAIEATEVRQARSERVWSAVSTEIAPGRTVLTVANPSAPLQPSPEFDAFLKVVDGELSLDEIAGRCGLTRAEAIFIGSALMTQGLVIASGSKFPAEGVFVVPEEFGSRKAKGR